MPPLMNTAPGAVFMSGGITYDGHVSKPGITELKGALYRIWCGVNIPGDSGVKVV